MKRPSRPYSRVTFFLSGFVWLAFLQAAPILAQDGLPEDGEPLNEIERAVMAEPSAGEIVEANMEEAAPAPAAKASTRATTLKASRPRATAPKQAAAANPSQAQASPTQAAQPAATQPTAGIAGSTTTTTASSTQAGGLAEKFISDGSPIMVPRLETKITPPADWEVITNSPSLSLVMQEQEDQKVVYNTPIYRRNITVATIQQPAPIDKRRAEELQAEITKTFGKDSMVTNFRIIEQRFFDFRGKADGILVYSAYSMGEFSLMQMHVLVSGEEHQYLMTYNDLAARFTNDLTFNKAWQAMVSLDVKGVAPQRYADMIRFGAVGGIMLIFVVIGGVIRSRRARRGYMEDADQIYSDNNEQWADDGKDLPATTRTGVWRLDGSGDLQQDYAGSMQKSLATSNFF